ncbi:membrane protein, drug/metabolite transporter (DMT) family protein [Parvularcula bermudensis HTCC2503]|uniref:Membrane protein, drug/metabolite transporter (DMT) family protein n=1 Tax=Parvularcula bermudensis (strain ATCC BAA-594 / HTCC2503 / KCTC 12087) TaxID=314260 RepID=E0TD85_PARBH|nr:EamA family transporter [Parvularcula bermudensis]ADM09908.1 membrane protein, drug/metabolite transporter (DMT) family protein [Parvularcula bermudensis HTCC2503]
MSRPIDLSITALAPLIWGSSYIVTTQFLPNLDPLTVSVLRALPAGLLLLSLVRELPHGHWIWKMFVLGALNFAVFWSLLFFAAYRLPGGVAAVMGALQPFVVILASRVLLGSPIKALSLLAVAAGSLGVALLVLTPDASLDMGGIVAGIAGSTSMAFGVVLSRKWQPQVSTLTFTAWQLTAGGLLLLPFVPLAPTDWSSFNVTNVLGLAYLGLIGAATTYIIWLRGIRKLHPTAVSLLGLLSPMSATLLGWLFLHETLSMMQSIGMVVVLMSVFAGQYALRPRPQTAKPRLATR